MTQPFLGQIQSFGFNFAPRNWALCNGQLMSIAQNTALFSLLGTMYGGDGRTTFALPDLRGRTSLHFGNGPGLTPRVQGEASGVETVTLLSTQMPMHNHSMNATNGTKLGTDPNGNSFGGAAIYTNTALNAVMSVGTIGMAGGSQPHDNMQPYLVINWCIALQGIFPSRN